MPKRKTEHMVAFWLRKLANEHNSKEVTARIREDGVCEYKIYREDDFVDLGLVFVKQTTKPKKLLFEVNGKVVKFGSVHQAAKKLNISRPTLTNLINGKTRRSYSLEYDKIKYLGVEK